MGGSAKIQLKGWDMKVIKGIPAASGIARGIICVYSGEIKDATPHYAVERGAADGEIDRVKESFEKARADMAAMVERSRTMFENEAAEIFNAHLSILNDAHLAKKIHDLILAKNINAEHAVSDVFEEYILKYNDLKGHFKELVHDFVDTRDRVLEVMGADKGGFKCPVGERKAVIVAAKRLTPSMVLNIPREHVLAFIAEEGGLTSHAVILARSYNVPIVLGTTVSEESDCGTEAIVDGSLGKVIIDPDVKTDKYYERKLKRFREQKYVCQIKKGESAHTKSGKKIKLKVNISTPEEFNIVEGFPHEGIGLLRTEFLFMQRKVPPSEEEQYGIYKHFLEKLGDKPVTVRLLDVGADKQLPYLTVPGRNTPDTVLRGAMAIDVFPEIYLTQAKALLRANSGSNLAILYPMVSDAEDLHTFKSLIARAKKELRAKKVKFNSGNIREGVMVETPGAVMMIREILKSVDFVNIGSNDLLYYTLAASRTNPLVAKRYHILHHALVRFMEIVTKEAEKAKKEVCLCGEVASFEEYYPLLLHIGLKSFSVAVSKFEDIKCRLMHIAETGGRGSLEKFYKLRSRTELDGYFDKFI